MRALAVVMLLVGCSSQHPASPVVVDAAAPLLDASRTETASDASVDAGRPPLGAVAADEEAVALAEELFGRWRTTIGVERAYTMNGGYRGMIAIEPAPPTGADRKHLAWVVAAMRDFDAFFTAMNAHATSAKRYRFEELSLLFFRSAKRTPSAYAHDWTVAWNVQGSLNTSADAARETLFHEIFHLNDYAHPVAGVEAWSLVALDGIFAGIVKKCGTATACLTPYTANDTQVRGGTYYAFQPGNGVREYAAELALRYYREQRAALKLGSTHGGRFKCGPPENGKAWTMMRDEFFAGVDLVPACG